MNAKGSAHEQSYSILPPSKADQDAHRLRLKKLAEELELPSSRIRPAAGRKKSAVSLRTGYWNKGAEDGDWQAALDLFEQRQDGGETAEPQERKTTVADLFNAFLNAKRGKVESGELSRRTFYDYNPRASVLRRSLAASVWLKRSGQRSGRRFEPAWPKAASSWLSKRKSSKRGWFASGARSPVC